MSNILITGVSSGIGKALTIKLLAQGHRVFGISRRKTILDRDFTHLAIDLSVNNSWGKILPKLQKQAFRPDIVIFNAAVLQNDFSAELDTNITEKVFALNFFSVIRGIESLIKIVSPKTQFIVISSTSALKGSSIEGIGYPASKAAIAIAFESLHQKYGNLFQFKTVFLGPVAGGMSPFRNTSPVILSEQDAVKLIIKSIDSNNIIFYSPKIIYLGLRIIRLLPHKLYFSALSKLENLHHSLKSRRI